MQLCYNLASAQEAIARCEARLEDMRRHATDMTRVFASLNPPLSDEDFENYRQSYLVSCLFRNYKHGQGLKFYEAQYLVQEMAKRLVHCVDSTPPGLTPLDKVALSALEQHLDCYAQSEDFAVADCFFEIEAQFDTGSTRRPLNLSAPYGSASVERIFPRLSSNMRLRASLEFCEDTHLRVTGPLHIPDGLTISDEHSVGHGWNAVIISGRVLVPIAGRCEFTPDSDIGELELILDLPTSKPRTCLVQVNKLRDIQPYG